MLALGFMLAQVLLGIDMSRFQAVQFLSGKRDDDSNWKKISQIAFFGERDQNQLGVIIIIKKKFCEIVERSDK